MRTYRLLLRRLSVATFLVICLYSGRSDAAIEDDTERYRPIRVSVFEFNGRYFTIRFSPYVKLYAYFSYFSMTEAEIGVWGRTYLVWWLDDRHRFEFSARMIRMTVEADLTDYDLGRSEVVASYRIKF